MDAIGSHQNSAVVVGVHPDRPSAALDVAAREALLCRAPLRLLQVPSADRPVVAAATAVLRAACQTWPELAIRSSVVTGDMTDALIEASRDAQMVVVGRLAEQGTSRRTGGGRIAGARTVAVTNAGDSATVAAYAACPSVIVPAALCRRGHPHVALALDISELDEPAIRFAFEQAQLRAVPLHVVHVWSGVPPVAIGSVDPFAYRATEADLAVDRLLSEALAGWAQGYPDVLVRRVTIHSTSVGAALVRAFAGAELAVVGANRHWPYSDVLISRAVDQLIQQAPCPLAVIRLSSLVPA